jgi:uncharacterized protein with PIN domain
VAALTGSGASAMLAHTNLVGIGENRLGIGRAASHCGSKASRRADLDSGDCLAFGFARFCDGSAPLKGDDPPCADIRLAPP